MPEDNEPDNIKNQEPDEESAAKKLLEETDAVKVQSPIVNSALEERVKRWEIRKKIFDIIAITVAAIWAFFTFSVKDLPEINKSMKISWGHRYTPDDNDSTKFILFSEINIENVSKNTVVVDSIVINTWLVPTDSVYRVGLWDVSGYMNRHATNVAGTYSFVKEESNPMLGTYVPADKKGHDFPFIIKKNSDTGFIYRVYIFAHRRLHWYEIFESKEEGVINFNQWIDQCLPDASRNKETGE